MSRPCSSACRASAVRFGQSSFTSDGSTWLRTVIPSAVEIRSFDHPRAASHRRDDRGRGEPGELERTSWACVEYGRAVSAMELTAALGTMNVVSREAGRFFTEYDLLLTPTMNTLALPLGRLDANADLAATDWARQLFDACTFTPLFNQTGAPAISLPLGQSSQGLPIGVQLGGAAAPGARRRVTYWARQVRR
ncbi:amidase family protein [Amycolatopsis circi]|uniref:amidase family protein n=1 Tax=Amycolatopsis circi TaxID=871959 RepID=UPI001FC9192B|nr:amidase family protein [Amycolatopsis circi]